MNIIGKKLLISICLFLYVLIELSQVLNKIMPIIVRHLIAYVFFCIPLFLYNKKTIKLQILKIPFFCILFYCILFLATGRAISFFNILNFFVSTTILVALSSKKDIKQNKYFISSGIILYLLNICVTIFEYKNQVNLFYFDMNKQWIAENTYYRFRSTGIWGHPLYSALIHGACMIFILMSDLKKQIKLILWFLGLFTIFLYDARAATIAVVLSSGYYIYKEGFFKIKNLIGIIFLCSLFYVCFDYISQSDIGGKLFDVQTKSFNDSSSSTRLIAIQIFFDLNPENLLFGVDDQFEYVRKRYGIICAENSFVGLTLIYGLPLAIFIFYLQSRNIIWILKENSCNFKTLIILYLLLSGLFNQALVDYSVWNTFILMYMFFCFNKRKIKMQNNL